MKKKQKKKEQKKVGRPVGGGRLLVFSRVASFLGRTPAEVRGNGISDEERKRVAKAAYKELGKLIQIHDS